MANYDQTKLFYNKINIYLIYVEWEFCVFVNNCGFAVLTHSINFKNLIL